MGITKSGNVTTCAKSEFECLFRTLGKIGKRGVFVKATFAERRLHFTASVRPIERVKAHRRGTASLMVRRPRARTPARKLPLGRGISDVGSLYEAKPFPRTITARRPPLCHVSSRVWTDRNCVKTFGNQWVAIVTLCDMKKAPRKAPVNFGRYPLTN